MPEGNLVRYLAPTALVVAALAILITWQSSVSDEAPPQPASKTETTGERGGDGAGGDGAGGDGAGGDGGGGGGGGERRERPSGRQEEQGGAGKTYTVQAGDSLSTIAERTGVDVQTLVRLNEDVDPQNLQAGDELQLGP